MKDLAYGKGYRYAHDEAGGFAAGETYFPEGMKPPSSTGRWSAGWRSASPTSCASCGR
jgi:replication-associated recombination protein RarA